MITHVAHLKSLLLCHRLASAGPWCNFDNAITYIQNTGADFGSWDREQQKTERNMGNAEPYTIYEGTLPVQILRPQTFGCTFLTLQVAFGITLHTLAYLCGILGPMAVIAGLGFAAPVVAVLCPTGVGVYAACDGLVATVRWQHGCQEPIRTPPPNMQNGVHLEPLCTHCRIALAPSAA